MDFARLLTPPRFFDEERTRIARLLYWILVPTFVINILDMLLLVIFAPETLPTFWINGILLACTFLSFWITQRGHLRAATFLICLPLWILTTFYLTLSGGVMSPALGLLGFIIIIGGVLLGTPGAIGFGLLTMLTTAALYLAGYYGWIGLPENLPSSGRFFATHTAIFFGLTLLMGVSARSIQQALTRAYRGEHELMKSNIQLRLEITERMRVQQEQARLGAILEATSDFVCVMDTSEHTIYLNVAARALMGFPEDFDITTTTIANYHPPDITEFIIREALPLAERNGTWSGETILRTHDGQDIPVSQVIIVSRNGFGQIENISTIIRDLREQRAAEQQRTELSVQKDRLEFFKEFLRTTSHDLKTPLSIINVSLDLLERYEDAERRKQKINQIRQQTQLLDKYVQDVLTLARLDYTPALHLTTLDLNALVHRVQMRLNLAAEAKNVTLHIKTEAGLSDVLADEQELYRALANLIENAINYTPPGGQVSLCTLARDGGIVAKVTDTGIGISPEALPHIFERFYRSDEAQQIHHGGTGLGLTIVKRVVEIHKGTIQVESTSNVGTTFIIWLPAAKPD